MKSPFEDATVLIAGGLGFIGSTLALRLDSLGAKVTILDALHPDYGGNLFNIEPAKNRLRVHERDLLDHSFVCDLVQGQDYLFNLAGQTSHLDSMIDPIRDLRVNCEAQLSLLEACRKFNSRIKIVYASTRQIYGRPQHLPVTESHPLEPVDINGIHKMAAEKYHLLYGSVYGIRTAILRLTNTIGPRMRIKDARQTFLGIWIRKLLEQQPIEVWGGKQLRDFTDVDDAVEAFLLAAAKQDAVGQIYNLGGPEVVDLETLAAMVVESGGQGTFRVSPYPADRKQIDIGDYYAEDTKIRNALGWTPRVPLRKTIERTIAYYREMMAHYV